MSRGLIVDNFAGGGGASTGIEMAMGRSVDIAINHDPKAIAMHKVNHPKTRHFCESVFDVDPITATEGKPVDLCWLSPDCTHFSKAKGSKPVSKFIRGLGWIAVRWALLKRPVVMMLENVEEYQTWGPVVEDENGNSFPCQNRKGETFKAFVAILTTGIDAHHPALAECCEILGITNPAPLVKGLGYQVEWRELRACDYGAPTIRKRLFMVARCDGRPIVWPTPTHAAPNSIDLQARKRLPYRIAAECIDWSLHCPSIFDRKKPLVDATLRRIARGLVRYVIEADKPFIANHANTSKHLNVPVHVSAFIAKHYGGGYTGPGSDLLEPLHTITSVDHNALVCTYLVKLRGTCKDGQSVNEPMPTITAGGNHVGEVRAFLLKYYGNEADGCELQDPLHTITGRDRFALVTVNCVDYVIVDIGMRMLQPHELFKAQGFPEHYIIDRDASGKRLTKTAQVGRCGNSVPPPLAEVLVRANLPELCNQQLVAA